MHRTQTAVGRQALILGAMVAPAPFAVDMFLPALPQITTSLETTVTATQFTLTAYFLTFALAHLLYGPWSDAKGRLPVLRWGVVVFLIGSAACALAPTIDTLIAARAVQATGAAALMVIPRAMIRDQHYGTTGTRLTALLMLVLSVSPLFAPLAGSLLLTFGDWRLIFAALAVGGAGSLAVIHFGVRETLPHIERYPVSRRALWVGMRRLFTDQTFVGLTGLASFGLANFFVFLAIAPYVYAQTYGLSHVGVSIALALNGMGFFITAQFSAPLSARWGADRAMLWGAVGFGIVIALGVIIANVVSLGLFPLVAVFACANACLGITIPTALCRALEPHGPIAGLAASVSGAIQMAVTGAMILFSSLALSPTPGGLFVALSICGTLVLVTALLVLRPRVGQRGWADGFEI